MILDFLSDFLSPIHSILMGFYLIPFLEHICLLPHFAEFVIFISMSLVACLYFPTLEMWPFFRRHPMDPSDTYPLVSKAIFSRGSLRANHVGPSVVVG